jgi:hypothetical protein
VFVPAPTLVGTAAEELPATYAAEPERSSSGANRDAIIAHSRAAYARPRAEVERLVAEQLGYRSRSPTKPSTRRGSVRRASGRWACQSEYVGAAPEQSSRWRSSPSSWTGCPTAMPRTRPV